MQVKSLFLFIMTLEKALKELLIKDPFYGIFMLNLDKQIVTCYSLLIAKVRKVFKKNKTAPLKQIQEKKKSAFSRESGKPSLI